jgi:hypothetical protein
MRGFTILNLYRVLLRWINNSVIIRRMMRWAENVARIPHVLKCVPNFHHEPVGKRLLGKYYYYYCYYYKLQAVYVPLPR